MDICIYFVKSMCIFHVCILFEVVYVSVQSCFKRIFYSTILLNNINALTATCFCTNEFCTPEAATDHKILHSNV